MNNLKYLSKLDSDKKVYDFMKKLGFHIFEGRNKGATYRFDGKYGLVVDTWDRDFGRELNFDSDFIMLNDYGIIEWPNHDLEKERPRFERVMSKTFGKEWQEEYDNLDREVE